MTSLLVHCMVIYVHCPKSGFYFFNNVFSRQSLNNAPFEDSQLSVVLGVCFRLWDIHCHWDLRSHWRAGNISPTATYQHPPKQMTWCNWHLLLETPLCEYMIYVQHVSTQHFSPVQSSSYMDPNSQTQPGRYHLTFHFPRHQLMRSTKPKSCRFWRPFLLFISCSTKFTKSSASLLPMVT